MTMRGRYMPLMVTARWLPSASPFGESTSGAGFDSSRGRNAHVELLHQVVATWPGDMRRRPSREGDGGRYGTPVTLHRR